MSQNAIDVKPGRKPRTVLTQDNKVLRVPEDWAMLAPGDATLTRRVKSKSPECWVVKEKVRRRMMSRGVWAPKAIIDAERENLEKEREDPKYKKRLEQGRARRAKAEVAYQGDFLRAVLDFLAFHPKHMLTAQQMAKAISAHATPVGSGTVARTKRISVERRAEAATIAWMRHQTTAYDHMHIPRVKGMRREVRAKLAKRSRELLKGYREGRGVTEDCPLQRALTTLKTP